MRDLDRDDLLVTRLAIVAALSACGRVGFDAIDRDGAASVGNDAIAYATPSVVQTGTTFDVASTIEVQLDPAALGDGLVVAIASYQHVTTVTDDVGDAFAQLVRQSDTNADDAEIWYATATHAGATTVTVMLATSNNTVVWVLELANIDATTPLLAGSGSTTTTSTTIATGPELTTAIPSIVVAVGAGGSTFDDLRSGPFTELAINYGDAAAYTIAAPGSYAASWDVSQTEDWVISAAAFRAAAH